MLSLENLNSNQREAVEAIEGPVLVLAGAGTGKTRVITYRVAYLIERGVPAGAILAVTFTNKAAGEMKGRISDLLRSSGQSATDVWVSTFHSFCARLLRRESVALGLPRDFAIYDDDDQTAAVKRALASLNLAAEDYPPRSVRAQISHAKNHGITPAQMESEAKEMRNPSREDVARIFRAYEAALRDAAALDFDDLLLKAVDLLRDHPDVRARWNRQFEYILVDEFQDTNASQEELVRLLAGSSKNVCVVGDEDQSIYGWRGARAGNLKRFTQDFPGARLIRLEQNYRSTQTILDAAAAVVENNSDRLGKRIEATAGEGSRLQYHEFPDAVAEAQFIGGSIASFVRDDADAHVAVLYRTGAQSRPFEEVLRGLSIRHRVVGGMSFYERAEVKTVLAYVRLLFHPEDNVALLRVLNIPPRGIGATTVGNLESRAREAKVSMWDALRTQEIARARQGGALNNFRELVEGMRRDFAQASPEQIIEGVLDRTGYLDYLEQQDNLEHTTRAENVRELATAVAESAERGETIHDVLDYAALVSDSDQYDESIGVSLMTLHSAKGLEFDAVFLPGLEEGLLPHSRSADSPAEIEEERRLFYVGMTRAKRHLSLSRAIYRRVYGEDRLRASLPSRFLREIPAHLVESAPGVAAGPMETRRYEPDPEYSEYSNYARRSFTPSRAPRGAVRASSDSRGRPASNPLIGTRVRHPKYGMGTITGVEGEGEERRLTVSFQDYGPKKLIERYANLQPA